MFDDASEETLRGIGGGGWTVSKTTPDRIFDIERYVRDPMKIVEFRFPGDPTDVGLPPHVPYP